MEEYFNVEALSKIYDESIKRNISKGLDKKNSKSYADISERQALFQLITEKIKQKRYKFTPYLELLRVKKRSTPPRMLSIPTVRDKLVLNSLKVILHETFPDSINTRQPNSYIKQIKTFIENNNGSKIHYVKLDIKHFYDNVEWATIRKLLTETIKDEYAIQLILDAISNPTVPKNYNKGDKSNFIPTIGVPQGLPISNILAQIYLANFDRIIATSLDSQSLYLRYVDDIIILSSSEANNIKELIVDEFNKIGLELNNDKTKKGKLNEGISFLGYSITARGITISNRTVENQINKIAGKITWFKRGLTNTKLRPNRFKESDIRFANHFIKEVNEIITGSKSKKKNYGWLYYYMEIDDLTVLYKLDSIILKLILKIPYFKGNRPKKLKTSVRAYNEIKFNLGGNYVRDYDKLTTKSEKKKELIEALWIEEDKDYSSVEIDTQYEQYVQSKIDFLKESNVY